MGSSPAKSSRINNMNAQEFVSKHLGKRVQVNQGPTRSRSKQFIGMSGVVKDHCGLGCCVVVLLDGLTQAADFHPEHLVLEKTEPLPLPG